MVWVKQYIHTYLDILQYRKLFLRREEVNSCIFQRKLLHQKHFTPEKKNIPQTTRDSENISRYLQETPNVTKRGRREGKHSAAIPGTKSCC